MAPIKSYAPRRRLEVSTPASTKDAIDHSLPGVNCCEFMILHQEDINRSLLCRRHTEFHERPKNHKCEVVNCRNAFRYPKDLRRHQITHEKLIEPQRCPFSGCNRAYNRKDNLQRHMNRCHKDESVDDPSKAVSEPKVKYLSLADLHQNSLGPSNTFGSPRQYGDHLDRHCSQAKAEYTTWKGERGLHSVVEPSSVESSGDFGHDDKERLPYPLRGFDSQDLEASLQGDRGETYEQSDTAEKLAHCQYGHEPPGHVDGSPVHCDAVQAPEFRKPGTVIPCPLPCPSDREKECSGKDENMATLL